MLDTLVTIAVTLTASLAAPFIWREYNKRKLAPVIHEALLGYADALSLLAESYEKDECGEFRFRPDTTIIETYKENLFWFGQTGSTILRVHGFIQWNIGGVESLNAQGPEEEFEGIPLTRTDPLVKNLDELAPTVAELARMFKDEFVNE